MWQQQSGQWWYCCFHALQKGDINKVVPIDKSSTVLSILLALIFLREGITGTKIVSVLLIGIEGIDSNLGTANPYHGSAAYGVAHGVCYRKTERDKGSGRCFVDYSRNGSAGDYLK